LRLGTVYRFAYDRDGSLLVATNGGLVRLRGPMPQKIASDVIPSAVDVLLDHSGTLWVATKQNVVARAKGDTQFHEVGEVKQVGAAFTARVHAEFLSRAYGLTGLVRARSYVRCRRAALDPVMRLLWRRGGTLGEVHPRAR